LSTLAYHAAWLALLLAGIALASALIARHLRRREIRTLKAEEMLQALACYAEWVADQRRAPAFRGAARSEQLLNQACGLATNWFPELSPAMAELAALHDELVDFLARQEALRLQDPELWLESDHDGRFMGLWREHRLRMHLVAERLRLAARPVIDAEPESIFPA